MLQGEHSAILLTFIELPFVFEAFVLSIIEWPLKTGFTNFYISDHNKLPFMAMLRNLRNLIKAGISNKHHTKVIRRLTDEVCTVLPAKSDSGVMFCLQSYQDLELIDHLCINPIRRIGLIHK